MIRNILFFIAYCILQIMMCDNALSASFQYGGLNGDIASTATAGATTTLVNTSKQTQRFTGAANQTLKLPDATTFSQNGWTYEVINESTGFITINDNGSNFLSSLPPHQRVRINLASNGSSNGTWSMLVIPWKAAGDLLLYNGTDAVIVPIATNNSALFVDTTATTKVAWKNYYATSDISGTDIDWGVNRFFTKDLGASTTFTFSNVSPGTINVRLKNNSSNYTVTWPLYIKWSNTTAPVMSPGFNSDVCTFIHDGTYVFGSCVQNFPTP